MTPSSSNDDDTFFNDLSRQPHSGPRGTDSPPEQSGGPAKTKRIACVICRKRKLKCDGNKPKCATCERLGHNCAYDEVRRKSGPKRGYVKDLEARLAHVETQLKSKDKRAKSNATAYAQAPFEQNDSQDTSYETGPSVGMSAGMDQSMPAGTYDSIPNAEPPITLPQEMITDAQILPNFDLSLDANFSWEMIGLGLEEPMPMQEAVDELTNVYFDKIHLSLPMINKSRFAASMDLNPERRPPICLRYIMWCLAASVTDKYIHHQEIFYKRARKYIEIDEMKGQGEAFVSVAHAQAWALIATYEFKMMYFPRAWMSVGRASRLALMMGLNRLDGVGMDVKQCLPPPKDWTEREERRRTFWSTYCIDRYASIGTGWPMTIDEKDIMTVLPASENAYDRGEPESTATLNEAMTPQQVASLSSFAGVCFISHFFGLNLTHLHRPEPNQREDDINGEFWRRHRRLDNMLSHTSLALPNHLRLPDGVRDSNVVFLNFSVHTSTICLHQAAIFKAERNNLSNSLIEESKSRCIVAAQDISRVMRLISNMDLCGMNPFMAFCLYVAARVFVQALKKKPDDQENINHLNLLLAAMRNLQRKNHLTESFLVQLNLDIEGSGLNIYCHNLDHSSIYSDRTNQPHALKGDYDQVNRVNQHFQPTINLSESTPETTTSPGDIRYPSPFNYNNKNRPLTRSQSPRQREYAFRNIDTISQDSRHSRAFFPTNDPPPITQPADFRQGNWNMFSTVSSEPTNVGCLKPPTNAINPPNVYDTEMSDRTNNSHSTGLTPQSSSSYNHSSSHTSPHGDGDPLSASMTQAPVNATYTSQSLFMVETGNGRSAVEMDGDVNDEQEDPFKIAADWDLGTGATPGPMTGMTPQGGWEKMMESWDRAG